METLNHFIFLERQTYGAKVLCQKGNSLDYLLEGFKVDDKCSRQWFNFNN